MYPHRKRVSYEQRNIPPKSSRGSEYASDIRWRIGAPSWRPSTSFFIIRVFFARKAIMKVNHHAV